MEAYIDALSEIVVLINGRVRAGVCVLCDSVGRPSDPCRNCGRCTACHLPDRCLIVERWRREVETARGMRLLVALRKQQVKSAGVIE